MLEGRVNGIANFRERRRPRKHRDRKRPRSAGPSVTDGSLTAIRSTAVHAPGVATYQDQPAFLRIAWQAPITLPGDFWVRFTRLEDQTAVLAEVRLGSALEGEEVFSAPVLSFDPTREPWALALLLTEPQG